MARVTHEFEEFFAVSEPRLRAAFVARYGPSTGRAVAVDALSYAWEHWDRVAGMDNPTGYLFRVGQSASRRYASNALPWAPSPETAISEAAFVPELVPAIAALPEQQRTVVVLVHGLGWTQRAVAELLDISPSSVQTHVERALDTLRTTLEVTDA